MVKFYISLLFIVFSFCSPGQNFSYLNASGCNDNEFPVDKDTNIYMFHGNRLVKTDKNLNPAWANTYSGINGFSRLLLSKTGSIYCIATTTAAFSFVIGKINSNGSVAWFRNTAATSVTSGTTTSSTSVICTKLFLDRNDQLIVSSDGGGFIKLDTNGNVLKFKSFGAVWYSDGFSILTDSSGYYKFVGVGYAGMGPGRDLGIYYYNDNTDLFAKAERIASLGTPTSTYFSWKLITSRFTNRFYVQNTLEVSSAPIISGIIRLSMEGKPKWSGTFSNFHGTPHAFMCHLDEDKSGDLFYGLSTGNFLANYTTAFMLIDSNGVAGSSSARSMLYNYPLNFALPPNNSPRFIYNNNYYFDISGQYFPSNPLTVQKFNSSFLSIPCGNTVSVSYSSGPVSSTFTVPASIPSIAPITSFTIPAFSSVSTPISFSINPNFCTVLSRNEIQKTDIQYRIYPNPANDKLFFNEEISYIEVFDVNGKNLKNAVNTSQLNISDLPNGIYFIRIKTDKGEFNRKFIKE
jgi:hypothetical protein